MSKSLPTTSSKAKEDLFDQAELVQQALLTKLASRRAELGLNQTELGRRAGVNRMTVQRAEQGVTSLTSFVALALAAGLTPQLTTESEPGAVTPHRDNISHRGYHFNRTKGDATWESTKREAALAKHWQAVNAATSVGLSPVMQHLVPLHTQDQASAVATAIQWLGSDVGFEFLKRALEVAGYDVVKR